MSTVLYHDTQTHEDSWGTLESYSSIDFRGCLDLKVQQ